MTVNVRSVRTAVLLGLVATSTLAFAESLKSSIDDVLVTQGTVTLTFADVDAFAAKMPPSERPGYFDSASRLDSTLKGLLLNRQVAKDARDLGLDKEPQVQKQIELAIEETLTRARISRFREELQLPDFSALAKEKYLANPDAYSIAAVTNVHHVLIGLDKHPEAEARAIAEDVRKKAIADPGSFEALVAKYSDDPSKGDNKGLIGDAEGGRFVTEFAEAANALTKPGDISPVTKTKFGFHVLKLDSKVPARVRDFADVEGEIVGQLSDDFVRSRLGEQLAKSQEIPIESNPEAVASLRTRYEAPASAPAQQAKPVSAKPVPKR